MIKSRDMRFRKSSANTGDFRAAFLGHVHELLSLGYARMAAKAFASEEEPAITGELVKAMNEVLDDEHAEPWLRFYCVHDDPPVNDGSRRGKRRKRIDIRVDSSEQRPRRRFCIEAKRLGSDHPIEKYLGVDGLGCFLHGHYAASDTEAGMLGYVQSGLPADWADQIQKSVEERGNPYRLAKGGRWCRVSFPSISTNTFGSTHMRKRPKIQITIYHTFLVFH